MSMAARPGEPWQEKLVRRFKEEPLVPIGCLITVFTLVMASTKVGKQGQSKSMNHWLRARVVAQGATIAAIVGGGYVYGRNKPQQDAKAQAAAAAEELRLKEKAEFEARLKAAEEAHALEESMRQKAVASAKAGGGFWSWVGWNSTKKEISGAATAISTEAGKAVPGAATEEKKVEKKA